MSSPDVMIFDMDIAMHQKKFFNGENVVPLAPPPSPNSSSKRKFANLTPIPMSRLIDCCEELVIKQTKNTFNPRSSKPLSMKRKTSDSDECCSSSSSSSSAGTSPGGTSDCSCSFGKRSRSSMNIDSGSFRRLNFSLSELSVAIAASETNDDESMEL
jgi:hypothetical protein